jgi:hypothetical protein
MNTGILQRQRADAVMSLRVREIGESIEFSLERAYWGADGIELRDRYHRTNVSTGWRPGDRQRRR